MLLITGSSGFIGQALIKALRESKDAPVRLMCVKSHEISTIKASENITGIVNLAGANVGKRWTASYKKVIWESRLNTTQHLIDLVHRLHKKPEFFISASAMGYYGQQANHVVVTEETIAQNSFVHRLCDAWEKCALRAETQGVRVCVMRLGVVLGKGGMLDQVYWPYKFFLGGRLGAGQQGFSWVHMHDVCRGIDFLMHNQQARGAYNFCAPSPVSQADFVRTACEVLGRPAYAHMPTWLVKALFGQMGKELLLSGAFMMPDRLQHAGFKFMYPELKLALQSIWQST